MNAAADRSVFVIATWFGLASGLLEGAGFLLLQALGWPGRRVVVISVTPDIVWAAPLFNVLLFNVVGLAVVIVRSWVPRLRGATFAVALFVVMACEALLVLVLDGHMHLAAVVILALGVGVTIARWLRAREAAALRVWRRSWPWLGAATLVALAGIEGGQWVRERLAVSALPPAPPAAPNVLVLVADTLRADHLSTQGYRRPTSPRLDRLARQGVLFENAFSTAPWTAPSHASLLTGLYPSGHGVGRQHPEALATSDSLTLPEALRERGYRTAAFSANLFWFTQTRGFRRGFMRFEDYFQSIADTAIRPIYGRALEKAIVRRLGFEDIPARRRAPDMNRSLLRWIDRDRTRPWFAFVNYMDVHDPYLPPRAHRRRFSPGADAGGLINEHAGRRHIVLTAAQLASETAAYDGAITYLDEQIGALLEGLRERGLLAHTVLVFTSDHGEALGDHGLLTHGSSLFAAELHVPLIVMAPGRVPAGVRVERPVTNAALPATVMDLVGADASRFPRRSLRPLWETPAVSADWEHPMAEVERIPWAVVRAPARHGSMKAVITPHWHYIVHEKFEPQLYDRTTPSAIPVNVAARPELRAVVEALRAEVLRHLPGGPGPEAAR